MAALQDLIEQIDDPVLKQRIETEVDKLTKDKKFGLVFEEHLPECTPLYDVPIHVGSTVSCKIGYMNDIYTVVKINDDEAVCIHKETRKQKTFQLDEIVSIAEFGEPIYPYLQSVDSVCNAPDDPLWHTLIEADNYHALQLLEYLYSGKVDCIYIDPPYNTGARDWKYNNDYVDSSDSYRHSKWLSMMEKRLKIAKKLLNPQDSVLIVTIDEKEYLHLGCLLEDLFGEANIQMISTRINATGIIRANEFTRVDEYIYIVTLGECVPRPTCIGNEKEENNTKKVLWHGLRRRDAESMRGTAKGGVAQFYPIYVNDKTCKIEKIGEALPPDVNRNIVESIPGCTTVFPLKPDGTEMNWGLIAKELENRLSKGYVRVKRSNSKVMPYSIEYLTSGYINDIETGKAKITGYDESGAVIVEYSSDSKESQLTTQWNYKSHYAKENGTGFLKAILGGKRFAYPKSIYAVEDCLKCFCSNKKDALIVDFFAGSGTTLHAVNLLNAEDGGHRRCIMVTNNEVSDDEAKSLSKQGYKPGDDEWERYGIARYVTWPRTVCSIEGHDINGNPLKGDYLNTDIAMSDGFKTNVTYFKLGFLDKTSVALGMQFRALLPVLWMKAGAIGKCPTLDTEELPRMMILPENRFAVLMDDSDYHEFEQQMAEHQNDIQTIFFVTDSESAYRSMASEYMDKDTYQLYRDYLDNFRINTGR